MKKIDLGENSKVNIKWKVLPVDYSVETEDMIIANFAKKYGISKNNVQVEPVFIKIFENGESVEYSNDIITNIQDPAYLQKLFGEYFIEKNIKGYDFDKIIEIDNFINESINFDVYEAHKRYSIKWFKWSNFMSYGPDNYFDFTKLKGLVRLSSEPANQGGKTTFCLDLFRFLLFGSVTSRENDWTLARAFNDFLPEATECSVEGCISIDGTDYVIKRVLTRPALKRRTEKSKVTQKVSYYKLIGDKYVDLCDEDDLENEGGSTTTETNKIIKDAIGNERDFDLMICVDSDNLKKLISLKDTERGRLISRWIGLLPLEEKDKIAREYFNKQILPSLFMTKYDKADLKTDIDELTSENEESESTISKMKSDIEKSEKKLKEYKETRDTLLQSKKDIDESLMNVDVETLKAEIDTIVKNGKVKAEIKKKNEEELEKFGNVDFDENEYKVKVREDKELTVQLNNKLSEYKRCQNEIDALQKGEYCPTCGAKLKNVDNTKAIEAKKNDLAKLKSDGLSLREKVNGIGKEISELDNVREKYNERMKLELLVAKNTAEYNKLIADYKEKTRLLNDIKANEDAIIKNNNIDNKLNIVSENISCEEKIQSSAKETITKEETNIKNNNKIIENSNKIINKIEEEEFLVRNWKLYLEMIGKNGISKMVLRTVLPMINGGLHNLLCDVCDFSVEVAIDDRNDVTFYKVHDGVKVNLGSGSGFEKTVSSLALRSVLGKISSFSKPSFVVFDEILGGVADENYDQVKKLYDKIANDYSCIIQITHLDKIADWHNHSIVVKKKDNVSVICSGE